jgi:hypothetical protein
LEEGCGFRLIAASCLIWSLVGKRSKDGWLDFLRVPALIVATGWGGGGEEDGKCETTHEAEVSRIRHAIKQESAPKYVLATRLDDCGNKKSSKGYSKK